MTSRRPIAAANWKMNLLQREASSFGRELAAHPPETCDVVVFPAFTSLVAFHAETQDLNGVAMGAQDLHRSVSGAHTGDLSGAQLLDVGCSWALAGHSERRADHREGDRTVGLKLGAGLSQGLSVMLCVGETFEEREAGATQAVLERQLRMAWAQAVKDTEDDTALWPQRLALAYEPVWAIGTGRTATPELAQEAHQFLRELLADLLDDGVASATRILYGGSVKPANCRELIAPPDIDGFLVGGASLDPSSFLDIIAGCA